MDNKTTFKRGDMFYADMPQGVGSEQSGYRPVIILQNDVGNMLRNLSLYLLGQLKAVCKPKF